MIYAREGRTGLFPLVGKIACAKFQNLSGLRDNQKSLIINNIMMMQKVYFIGIGGIGMSALARYFNAGSCEVCGYDRTETPLTRALCSEGISVHYEDNIELVRESFKTGKEDVLVVYTPAVPEDHSELRWFRQHGYNLKKRSQVLGMISESKKTIAVAGTHGKTSVSTMTAHLLTFAGISCDAFLGGISKNYHTNLLLAQDSRFLVAEADEYDRSFLQLHPCIAVVTATDADHLDIYGTHTRLKEAFGQFVSRIAPGGILIVKHGLQFETKDITVFSYSLDNSSADFFAGNISTEGGYYTVTVHTPCGEIENLRIGVPGLVNVENSVAAIAAAMLSGVQAGKIREAMAAFEGVQRRFDYRIKNENIVYIDDYAHHPEELRFTIESVRELYPGKRITGIFQPHLYTRTRDFAGTFAESLGLLDALILLDIYPAREKPIDGVDSNMILNKVNIADKCVCTKEKLLSVLKGRDVEVLLTLGAGDIDTLVQPIEDMLKEKQLTIKSRQSKIINHQSSIKNQKSS
jgi:UDP-N-acetylmuramate--alanine ligase